eukprot:5284838-Lingulodinium_polyedra.AAC.1
MGASNQPVARAGNTNCPMARCTNAPAQKVEPLLPVGARVAAGRVTDFLGATAPARNTTQALNETCTSNGWRPRKGLEP